MDQALLRWARARAGRKGAFRPVIWLFTDAARLPDPLPAVRRLPRGLAGVIFRPDGLTQAGRAALGHALVRLCRARRLVLVVAGDARLAAALGAGVHLRDGRWPGPAGRTPCKKRLVTSSAHDGAALIRARRAGARLAFLSPLFPTASHPGAPGLGPTRFAALSRRAGLVVAALGGIEGSRARFLTSLLGRRVVAVGAIGALAFVGSRDSRLRQIASDDRCPICAGSRDSRLRQIASDDRCPICAGSRDSRLRQIASDDRAPA